MATNADDDAIKSDLRRLATLEAASESLRVPASELATAQGQTDMPFVFDALDALVSDARQVMPDSLVIRHLALPEASKITSSLVCIVAGAVGREAAYRRSVLSQQLVKKTLESRRHSDRWFEQRIQDRFGPGW